MFVKAIVLTLLVRLITLFPLRLYKKWITCSVKNTNNINDVSFHLAMVIKTMRRIKKYFPFDSSCLVNAIVAKKILAHKGIYTTLYFGVNKNGKQLLAHAWLKHHENIITGGNDVAAFTIVYTL